MLALESLFSGQRNGSFGLYRVGVPELAFDQVVVTGVLLLALS